MEPESTVLVADALSSRALIGSIALLVAVSKAEPESKKLFLFSCNTKSFAHLIYCLTSLIMLLKTDNQFWVTRKSSLLFKQFEVSRVSLET